MTDSDRSSATSSQLSQASDSNEMHALQEAVCDAIAEVVAAVAPEVSSASSPYGEPICTPTGAQTREAAFLAAPAALVAPPAFDIYSDSPAEPVGEALVTLPFAHAGLGAPAGHYPLASQSVRLCFPEVEERLLHAAAVHTLEFRDLAHLDPFARREVPSVVCTFVDDELRVSARAATAYFPSVGALVGCTNVYFQILAFHAQSRGVESMYALTHGHVATVNRLLSFAKRFVWGAVLAYFGQYYLRRRAEMAAGFFTGWWDPDPELVSRHLVGRRRTT